MAESEYAEAAVEVLSILSFTEESVLNKIPKSFISFLSNISSHTYKVSFDYSLKLNELNLKSKTKEILGFIYINWLCDDNQREIYKKEIMEQREFRKNNFNYKNDIFSSPNDTFRNNNINLEDNIKISQNTEMVEYKNFFKTFIDKIIMRFKK